MRFIPTRIHGLVDYAMGVLLIIAPWVLGFGGNNPQTWIPVLLGVASAVYSLCTRYEVGAFPLLDMPVHLWLDFGGGLLLAASPWLFGFAGNVWAPHLILGLLEMGMSLMTQTVPTRIGFGQTTVQNRGL